MLSMFKACPELIHKKYSLCSAYTPLFEVTLLHICAKFNRQASALELISQGSDTNAPPGFDEFGFGGQTAIFNSVNQNGNQSSHMLNYFLSLPVDVTHSVKGLIWGKVIRGKR